MRKIFAGFMIAAAFALLFSFAAFALLFSFAAFAEDGGVEVTEVEAIRLIPIATSAGENGYFNADGSEDEDDVDEGDVDYSVPRYEWKRRYVIDETFGVDYRNERFVLATGEVDRWHSNWLNNIVLIIAPSATDTNLKAEVLVPNSILEEAGLRKNAAVLWSYNDGQIEMVGIPAGDGEGLYVYPEGGAIYFLGDMVAGVIEQAEFDELGDGDIALEGASEVSAESVATDNPATGTALPVFAVVTAAGVALITARKNSLRRK